MKVAGVARDWLALSGARAAGGLLERLPLERAHALARRVSRVYITLGGRRVRWAHANLRIAFPSWTEADRSQLVLESCVNVVLNLIDLRRSEHWDDGQVLARFRFEGLEHLDAVLGSGRSALLLSLHMGCYDLGLRALSLRRPALRFAAIATTQRNPRLQAWLSARRNARAVELIPPGPGAALRALRIVRSGRPLILLGDLYKRAGRRVQAPLFGKRCLTPTGLAVLARLAPASILPCYIVRDAPDQHTLRILPELELPAHAQPGADEAITAACNAALEDIIRKHPEHWTWAHRRFRHSPDVPSHIYRSRHQR